MNIHRLPYFVFASGLLGALALAFLIAGLAVRDDGGTGVLFRIHDALAACSSITISLSAASWRTASTRYGGEIGTVLPVFGAVSAALTALSLSLVYLTRASDMLYMLPQGGIGLWLIATSLKQPTSLSRSLCIFGFVVGTGLLLVGAGFSAIAAAQGPELWSLSHQALGDPDPAVEASRLNVVGHQVLLVGTLLGVALFPVWAVLAARALRAVRPQL